MNLATSIDLGPFVTALRPLEKTHVTLYGERRGFLMIDATRALGGLAKASQAMAALMLAELLDGEFVVIDGDDAQTLYRMTGVANPVAH